MNMLNNLKTSGAPSRDGVALILVLGFLSLLLILAVAFSSNMRVERMATRNFSDVVAARNLVDVAVARAMTEYDTLVGNGMFPSTPVVVSTLGTNSVDNILKDATGYIPRRYVNPAALEAGNVKWDDIELLGDTGADPLRGRIAFMVVDTSGLLDANFVGLAPRPIGRRTGTNTFEIAADGNSLTSLEISDRDDLLANRNTFFRYETLPEFSELGKAAPAFLGSGDVSTNFNTYSYFPSGYWEGGAEPIEQPLVLTGAFDRVAVQTKLEQLGFAAPNELAMLVQDYLDPDFKPALPMATYSSESVPMINEIVITNTISAYTNSPGVVDWTNKVQVSVELWYPFVAPTNPLSYEVALAFQADSIDFSPNIPLTDSRVLPGPWSETDNYRVASFEGEITLQLPEGSNPNLPTQYLVGALVRDEDGMTVDQALTPGSSPFEWSVYLVRALPTPNDDSERVVAWMVNDPRINWDMSDRAQWMRSRTETLLDENTGLTYAAAGNDGDTVMYAASRPDMQFRTIGEFGYLLYDKTQPWRTIRFWGPDAPLTARVLDGFTLNRSRKGYVNVNSDNITSLAAVLVDAPIDQFPGEDPPAGNVLAENDALILAGRIAVDVNNNGAHTTRSGISRLPPGSMYTAAATNSLMAEAAIRNSIDLLHTRQNLVTVIAAAQIIAVAPDNSERVVAEQRAVAQVWRDPYPDGSGGHPTFTRFFKWLD